MTTPESDRQREAQDPPRRARGDGFTKAQRDRIRAATMTPPADVIMTIRPEPTNCYLCADSMPPYDRRGYCKPCAYSIDAENRRRGANR